MASRVRKWLGLGKDEEVDESVEAFEEAAAEYTAPIEEEAEPILSDAEATAEVEAAFEVAKELADAAQKAAAVEPKLDEHGKPVKRFSEAELRGDQHTRDLPESRVSASDPPGQASPPRPTVPASEGVVKEIEAAAKEASLEPIKDEESEYPMVVVHFKKTGITAEFVQPLKLNATKLQQALMISLQSLNRAKRAILVNKDKNQYGPSGRPQALQTEAEDRAQDKKTIATGGSAGSAAPGVANAGEEEWQQEQTESVSPAVKTMEQEAVRRLTTQGQAQA